MLRGMWQRHIVFFLVVCWVVPAIAGQGVPSPYVNKDTRLLITDGFYTTSNGRPESLRTRLTYDHGMTERLQLRERVVVEDDRNDDYGPRSVELSGRYELAEPGVWPVDLGIYAGVLFNEGGNLDYTARLLAAKTYKDWQWRSNVKLTLSAGDGWSRTVPEIRFRLTRFLEEGLAVSGEYFSLYTTMDDLRRLTNTRQQLGVLLAHRTPTTPWRQELGLLKGLNDQTADYMLKWRLAYGF